MSISIGISLTALVVSCVSLFVSIFNAARDRAKVKAWSEFFHEDTGNGNSKAGLKVFISNIGRRPIAVKDLVRVSGKTKWARTLSKPKLPTDEDGMLETIPTSRDYLAHTVAVALSEGQVFEYLFLFDDYHEYITQLDGTFFEADSLEVSDVAGKKYPVKYSKENLKSLYDFSKQNQ